MQTETAEPVIVGNLPAPTHAPSAAIRPSAERLSWWLWPHVLSLDAPLVAVVWQYWWARCAGVALPGHAAWILSLGVWAIYLADRLADTAEGHLEIPLTLRHAFHFRWRSALMPLALLAGAALVLMTPRWLEREIFTKGLVLLAGAGGYFWLIHNRRFRIWQRIVPKEAFVGGMFALGTVFFPWCYGHRAPPGQLLAIPLFGALCACNCALITYWENNAQDLADPVSLLNAFPHAARRLGTISLMIAVVASGLLLAGGAPLFAPVAVSGVLLASLDYFKDRFSIPALRVLVDAALLTPLIGLLT